jgi:formylglycine-generating enzyme required for sulfatase activity
MGKRYTICSIVSLATTICMFNLSASANEKVVVVPLGGTVGNATVADVVQGKTFSSKDAGKGATGTLKVREGGTIYTNSIGMEFSLIPAGSFVMGSPDGTGDATHRPVWPAEAGRDSDERQHIVSLSTPFYMQTTEVTQGQWTEIMGSNPSSFDTCGTDCPVESVSWNDAQNFIDALNAREGRTNCHTTPNTCYSLPTESQWEYAARGGTVTAFYNGDITNTGCSPLDPNLDKIGWYCGNANSTTHPVAGKVANNWGLYDMSGNVWEWCEDVYDDYPDGPVTDPPGGTTGSNRVIRGGSWDDFARYARSAGRSSGSPDVSGSDLGFRVGLASGQ